MLIETGATFDWTIDYISGAEYFSVFERNCNITGRVVKVEDKPKWKFLLDWVLGLARSVSRTHTYAGRRFCIYGTHRRDFLSSCVARIWLAWIGLFISFRVRWSVNEHGFSILTFLLRLLPILSTSHKNIRLEISHCHLPTTTTSPPTIATTILGNA